MKNAPHQATEKMLTGIVGFDEITGGGLPRAELPDHGGAMWDTVFALQPCTRRAQDEHRSSFFRGDAGQIIAMLQPSLDLQSFPKSCSFSMPDLSGMVKARLDLLACCPSQAKAEQSTPHGSSSMDRRGLNLLYDAAGERKDITDSRGLVWTSSPDHHAEGWREGISVTDSAVLVDA